MIVAGFDLEATGLDLLNDRPIEMAASLWSTAKNRSIESESILVKSEVPVSEEITEITGITQGMVDKFGYASEDAFDRLIAYVDSAEAIVAFNGHRFDFPMSVNWAKRLGRIFPEKFMIDPSIDLPMRSQELITMCAKKKIYYDAHEAGADVGAMLRLMASFPLETVLERANSPMIVVQSLQGRNENDRAKRHKFRWNPDEKIWWKAMKECDLTELIKAINNDFGIKVRSDFTPDMLETQ